MRARLTSRVFTDFNVEQMAVLQVNYHLSIKGKVNALEISPTTIHNCRGALFNSLQLYDTSSTTQINIKRGLTSKIDSSGQDIPQLTALRRRNIPLPPSGILTILKAGTEEKLKGATLRRGDTHVILLTAVGDFPSEPEIVFAMREDSENLIVKSNLSTQSDICVLDITPANLGDRSSRLSAQIVIHPEDTANIPCLKTLFYTVEIVDVLAQEVYTIESDKLTIEPDIINYFSMRSR